MRADGSRGQGTTVEPMVGMNWHCFSVVVTWPKIVDMMLPEPVSAIAVSVVGPSGLMSDRGLSVGAARLAGGQVDPGDVQRQLLLGGRAGRADRGEHIGGLARRRGPAPESWPARPPRSRSRGRCRRRPGSRC